MVLGERVQGMGFRGRGLRGYEAQAEVEGEGEGKGRRHSWYSRHKHSGRTTPLPASHRPQCNITAANIRKFRKQTLITSSPESICLFRGRKTAGCFPVVMVALHASRGWP